MAVAPGMGRSWTWPAWTTSVTARWSSSEPLTRRTTSRRTARRQLALLAMTAAGAASEILLALALPPLRRCRAAHATGGRRRGLVGLIADHLGRQPIELARAERRGGPLVFWEKPRLVRGVGG